MQKKREGMISEQFYGTGEKRQGPYSVQQGYTGGKHWSKRVNKDRVDQVRADIHSGIRFRELCQEFAELTEQETIAQDQPGRKKPRSPERALPGNRSVPEGHRGPVCPHRPAGYVLACRRSPERFGYTLRRTRKSLR